jgi:isopenicillin N synthase-like dioxygenase
MNISIPSVNFRKLNEKNKEEIDTLRRGLIETGFFYVFEHGICAKLLKKVEESDN